MNSCLSCELVDSVDAREDVRAPPFAALCSGGFGGREEIGKAKSQALNMHLDLICA